jgi:hypothetical protein
MAAILHHGDVKNRRKAPRRRNQRAFVAIAGRRSSAAPAQAPQGAARRRELQKRYCTLARLSTE